MLQHLQPGVLWLLRAAAALQPTPAPLPTKGLWGCCTSCTQVELSQLLKPASCGCFCAAAALPQPVYDSRASGVLPQLCCGSCSWFPAAALVLQLHCCQPPPRYQSRGYGGAAIAALPLLLTCSTCSSRCPAAAGVLQAHSSHPRPVTNQGAMGGLHSGHSFRTAADAAGVLQLLLCSSSCVACPSLWGFRVPPQLHCGSSFHAVGA